MSEPLKEFEATVTEKYGALDDVKFQLQQGCSRDSAHADIPKMTAALKSGAATADFSEPGLNEKPMSFD